ncbi:hypothetical protein DL93DRAFT_1693320 [Clavulina sp. PMI_390]|nr:hypothetical protein DL93DRAFT_1693320 [Clavulina sp. PMI_390]
MSSYVNLPIDTSFPLCSRKILLYIYCKLGVPYHLASETPVGSDPHHHHHPSRVIPVIINDPRAYPPHLFPLPFSHIVPCKGIQYQRAPSSCPQFSGPEPLFSIIVT